MREAVGFAIGLLVGSFLNVCIWRLPRDESIVWPGSACPACKKPIHWFDNVPVLSFLLLGARCRNCRARIHIRYPIVEILGGCAVALAVHVYGFTPYGVAAAGLFCAFVAITIIDLEHEIIPDEITFTCIAAGLIFSTFFPGWHGAEGYLQGFLWSLVGFLAGGGILYGIGVFGEMIFKKEAMGGGDVKLMAGVGAFLGWKAVLMSLFLASFFGGIVGMVLKYGFGKERLAFGPYLVLGALIHMLWGDLMLTWYFDAVLK